METRKLGNTGIDITVMGFGAWAIGGRGYGEVDERDAVEAIETYLNLGGNFIDTARRYGNSERILGDYFKRTGKRDDVIIASKSGVHDPAELRDELEKSLRLLQCNTIDLFYLHSPPDDPDEMNRLLDEYDKFKREGKIRAIGASIKGPNVTQHTVDLCRQYIQSERVDALQVIYSIFRQKNREIFAEAYDNGVGIVTRTALESGFLTGKYKPGTVFPENDHRHRWQGDHLDNILNHVQGIIDMVEDLPYESVIQLALRYAIDAHGISSVIHGGKIAKQVVDNMRTVKAPMISDNLHAKLSDSYGDATPQFNTG